MNNISLAAYNIHIRAPKSAELLPMELDFFELIRSCLENLIKSPVHEPKPMKVLRVTRLEPDPPQGRLDGILETGEYGYSATLVDVAKKFRESRRIEEQAELLPFFFLLKLPSDSNRWTGIAILQRFGVFGMKEVLEYQLDQCIRAAGKMIIEMNPLVPRDLVNQWTNPEEVRRIRLVHYKPVHLLEDWIDRDGKPFEADYELMIKAKKRGTIPLHPVLARALSLAGEKDGFLEIREATRAETVKFEVDIGGKRKTVDATNLENFRAFVDVTDKVTLDGGHPTFSTIRDCAEDLLRSLEKELSGPMPAGEEVEGRPPGIHPVPVVAKG